MLDDAVYVYVCIYIPFHKRKTDTEEELLQLVLATSLREKVIRLAHSIPLAEHLDKRKMTH